MTFTVRSCCIDLFPRSAILRVGLVVLLMLAVIATILADPFLRRSLAGWIGDPLLLDAVAWMVRLGVWCVPLLWCRRFRQVGSLRLRKSWTVFLVLPYLLLNAIFFRGFPEGHSWVQAVGVGMAVGAWEELGFRGYALSRCAAHPRFAICVSSLGFAFLHLGYPLANIITVFFVAVGFGILRVVSGSLGWCILIHGLTNVLAGGANPPDGAIIPVALTATAMTLFALWRHPKLRPGVLPPEASASDAPHEPSA